MAVAWLALFVNLSVPMLLRLSSAHQQLPDIIIEPDASVSRGKPTQWLPLDLARSIMSDRVCAPTTRRVSSAGESSSYWLNPQSRRTLAGVLGKRMLAQRLELQA